MITWENYEEYIMMYADGELLPAEVQALMAFVEEHPELKKELELYEMAHIAPDITEVYAAKNKLMKEEPARRVMAFPSWQRYAIAAGVAALLFFSVYKFSGIGDAAIQGQASVATNHTAPVSNIPQHNGTETTNPATHENTTATNNPADHENNNHHDIAQSPAINEQQVPAAGPRRNPVSPPSHSRPAEQYATATLEKTTLQPISMNNPLALAATHTQPEAPVAQTVPAAQAVAVADADEQSLLQKLPIDEAQKRTLENVAEAMSNTADKIQEIKHNIAATSLSVRVEKKKLILSF